MSEKVSAFVIAFLVATACRLFGLVIGSLGLAWLPMLLFGAAHNVNGLGWVPQLGYFATWVLTIVVASVVFVVKGSMELVSVDISKLLK